MIAMKILAACLLAFQPAQDPGTLRGVLRHDPKLEGGVWTLTVDGKVYDLHGDLEGRADGDRVEVEGVAHPHRACIHQVGTLFRVTRIRLLVGDGRREVSRRFF
ncbi:MAG TPA: hypothetical protein VJB14_10575 [Planctomycetota bacterium]|nr:hypothetical protein [Planctomycetota bacterium]